MAKRSRRRFYKRKSGRWSSNLQEVSNNISATSDVWSAAETIMTNPIQQPSLVSQTYTVKNIECSFTIETEGLNDNQQFLENICCYIMFVPQGMAVTSDYNLQHPEYIMNYKYLGSPSSEFGYQGSGQPARVLGQQYQPIKFKTRLSRKLQTGDGVILFIKGINQSSNTVSLICFSPPSY